MFFRNIDAAQYIIEILKRYGTAKGSYRNLARPEQAYLAGLG
jgi:hypothetical protein